MEPFVSIITPTANRREFIPQLLKYFAYQTWPADRLELVVLDDGQDSVADLFQDQPRVRYHRDEIRHPVGSKRNRLVELAQGEIIVHMDDDDWYPPDRVERAVRLLQSSKRQLVGKSDLFFYDTETEAIHKYPVVGKYHSHAGYMAYYKTYWEKHPFANVARYEEGQFTENYTTKLAQFDVPAWQVVLCISHGDNVLEKNTRLPKAEITLSDVIADPDDRAFYENLF